VCTMAIAGKKLSVFEGRMRSVITINVSAGHGGSITPSARVAIGYGLSKMFAITPRWGYATEDVVVDGVSVGPVSIYMFSNLTENHTISVTFRKENPAEPPPHVRRGGK
jgi:endoglucanase